MAGSLMDVFVKIGADTSGLESGIGKAKGLASGLASGVTGAIGAGVKLVGGAIAGATTAVSAFATSAVNVGKNFDSSMSQVAATMGVTTDEIGELRDFAMDMGAKTAFSATQAADALNYMALAGYNADTSMKMLPNVLNLAAAGDMELARASDMVTDAQTALGLSLSETTELVDMMAKTSSKSNTSVAQLGDAILTVGGTAKSLAGGTNELNMMLGVLADNGIKGAEGGTHLRNAILSLSAPTDNAAKTLNELGIVTKDVEGNMLELPVIMSQFSEALDGLGTAERADIISTIFNKTDIAAMNALIDTSSERYRELSVEIDGAWMSEKAFQDEMKGTGLENAQKKLEALGISQEDFMVAAKTSKGSAQEFVQALHEISGVDTNVILGTMQTNLSDLQRTFDAVTGSAEQMAQTQLDNLSGDITLWKSALEGAQLLLSGELAPTLREFVKFGTEGLTQISDAFKADGLTGAMEAFKDVLSKGVGMVVAKVPEFVNAGIELVKALGQGIVDNASTIFDGVLQIGSKLAEVGLQLMQFIADGIAEFDFAQAAEDFVTFLKEAFNGGGGSEFLEAGLKIVTGLFKGILEAAPVLIDAGVDILNKLAEGISNGLPKLLPSAMNTLMAFSADLRQNAGKIVDAGIKLIMGLATGLINGLPTLIETVPTIITNIAEIINDNAPKLLVAGIELIVKLIAGIVKAVPTLIAEFPKIIRAIIAVFSAINWLNLGAKIITGIVNGVKGLASSLPDTMKGIGHRALEFVKNIDWKNLGRNIIKFVVNGVKALTIELPNTLKAIANAAFNAVKNIDWLGLGKAIINGVVDGLKALGNIIMNTLLGMAEEAWNKITAFFGGKEKESGEGHGGSGGKIKNAAPPIMVNNDELPDYTKTKRTSLQMIENNLDSLTTPKNTNIDTENDYYETLADAIVSAFLRANVSVECDNREFGRLVRKLGVV